MFAILSVDFDYFIMLLLEERARFFLKGGSTPDQLSALWAEQYARYPELRGIGVADEYYYLKPSWKGWLGPRAASQTHRAIKDSIDRIPRELPLRIVNIDFHHDYYHYFSGSDYCNCGNWLRRVMEERPPHSSKWIRGQILKSAAWRAKSPEHTTDLRCVFTERLTASSCRSPEWSPPHLSCMYEEWCRRRSRPQILGTREACGPKVTPRSLLAVTILSSASM